MLEEKKLYGGCITIGGKIDANMVLILGQDN